AKMSLLNQKFSANAVKKLVDLGLVFLEEEIVKSSTKNYGSTNKNITLTARQQEIVKTISNNVDNYLLFGVTGSGKTEVYMNVIKNMLQTEKTAIMLVPEISLTPQVLKNFKSKFGDDIAILHSGLSVRERFDEWFRIFNGEAKIVVGARSAIFAPIKNIGIIVIDEDHDTSYYSESNPRYSTIEVAKFRAKFNNASLVLGSATPDVERCSLACKGEYKLLEMPERVNKAPMPKFDIVDMLGEIRDGNSSIFSRKLVAELCDVIKNKKQAMLYLNRRGYQSSVVCRDCGYVVKCENCDVPLVYHKEDKMLKCHFCDARYHTLAVCPNCGSGDLRYGAIGTQKVVEELEKLFPHLKVFRMDNDNTRSKDAHYNILSEFQNTPASVLVGTQMIAKGHDFPLVTLVGIIDADMGLHFADFRANERTFELITQVAGRAGRGEYEGKVVLQTYMPKHYTYRCAVNYDYKNFFKHELNIRETTKFPPFTSILRILISGEDEQKVIETTKDYFEKIKQVKLQNPDSFVFLNAMKCPVKRIQNKFRYQILMRIFQKDWTNIRDIIYDIDRNTKQKDVMTFVEVNPQNLS
ncbi:MAG: primosomal protein N', partial [Clostridia bacterium]|nr:primosomal protein N' [Clostridia bacterium]